MKLSCFNLAASCYRYNIHCHLTLFLFWQLKSSLLLHLDGTSAVAEDIGRQVHLFLPI